MYNAQTLYNPMSFPCGSFLAVKMILRNNKHSGNLNVPMRLQLIKAFHLHHLIASSHQSSETEIADFIMSFIV